MYFPVSLNERSFVYLFVIENTIIFFLFSYHLLHDNKSHNFAHVKENGY